MRRSWRQVSGEEGWRREGWATYVDGERFEGIGCPFRYQDADREGKDVLQGAGELEEDDGESD